MKYKLTSYHKKILADTITPVSVYLKIRDRFPNSILLESSDYHANDNSFSYICCNPIASIKIKDELITQSFPDGSIVQTDIIDTTNVPQEIHKFTQRFSIEKDNKFKFIHNGIFGYIGYDAVRYFEDVKIEKKEDSLHIPDIYYAVYQNIIAINHFKNDAYIFAHCFRAENNIDEIHHLIKATNFAAYNFKTDGDLSSNLTDNEYKGHVELARKHCARGDVFQLVLSKKFKQHFKGDEFNVYRALRSINPSPYLFYFDYGDFKIFGSSPEAQLIVNNGQSEIHPIAGTFKRTGNDEKDTELAKQLSIDEKEFFSHVIHLVSKVTGQKHKETPTMQIVADTFPAGTLSGAPKHMAMQLIEKYEKTSRGFYGGAIGFMDFDGNFNHAIMIRTFLSKDHQLHWQAGAGLVSKSDPEKELQEVYNKLGALTNALEIAERI